MKISLLVFLIGFSISSKAITYIGLSGNVSKVSYDSMSEYNVKPIGTGIGYLFGMRTGFVGLELSFADLAAKGKIKHDGVENNIKHSQKTYSATLNLYLNPRLYFKFGYGLYQIDQTLETSVSSSKENSIKEIYGLINETKSGLHYGLAFDFFKKKKGFNLFTSIDRYNFDKTGATNSIQFGVKWQFSLGFNSVFSR